MDHDVIRSQIPAYALGAADNEDAQAVAAHLRDCPACRALVAEYEQLLGDMAFAMPPAMAPVGLESRLRHVVLQEAQPAGQRVPWWRRIGPLGIVAAALIVLVLTNVYWFQRTQHLQQEVTAQAASLRDLISGPAYVLRGDDPDRYAYGVVYAPKDGNTALLCLYDMQALPQDKTYQVWLVKDGQRSNGGLLQVSGEGFGVLVIEAPEQLSEYQGIGITVEPAGGSVAPTSPRIIGGSL